MVAYEVTSSMSYENGSICRTAEIAQAESEWMRQNGKRAVSEREEEKKQMGSGGSLPCRSFIASLNPICVIISRASDDDREKDEKKKKTEPKGTRPRRRR